MSAADVAREALDALRLLVIRGDYPRHEYERMKAALAASEPTPAVRDKMTQIGPFETERQALDSPAVRAVHAAFDADPGAGKMHGPNLAMLLNACSAAEVTLGEYDRRIVSWLAGWEPTTVVVIAGLIRRAADGPEVLLDGDR